MGINDALRNPQQRAYLFVAIVFTVVSVVAVILRFVATRRAGRRLQVEDWLALASLLLYLAFGAVNLVDAIIASGRDAFALIASPDDFAAVRKLIYAAFWLYFYQQLFVKLSILALYYRLFWVKPVFRWCTHALLIYHIAWITVTSFLIGFHCRPLDKFWDPHSSGYCTSTGVLLAVTETLNSFGDFLLVALAVVIIGIIQVSKSAKRRLVSFFGLGVLAGTIGFVKIGLSFNNDDVYVFTLVALWSNVQAGVGIVCCCAPVYQPLLPAPGIWARAASKLSFPSWRLSQPRSSANRSRRSRGSWLQASSQDRQQYWLQREDGTSTGLVWSDVPRDDSGWAAEEGYDLQAIQVRSDIEVSRKIRHGVRQTMP